MHSALVYAGSYQRKSTRRHVQAGGWSYTAACSSVLLVSINADCFDTLCRPSVALNADQFLSCQIKGWYTATRSTWSIGARLRACEPAADTLTSGSEGDKADVLTAAKPHPGPDRVLCSNMQGWSRWSESTLRIAAAPVGGWGQILCRSPNQKASTKNGTSFHASW